VEAVRRRPASRALIALLLVCLSASGSAAADGTFDHGRLARTAVDRHVRPGYVALAAAGETLATRIGALCTSRSEPARQAATAAFAAFVGSWGRIEHVRFGPIAEGNRLDRILFWPDRRGIAARQVRRLLDTRDPAALDPEALARRSVGMQGIGALESLLHGPGSDRLVHADGDHRCGYARTVARLLARTTREVSEAWADGSPAAAAWLATAAPGPVAGVAPQTTVDLSAALLSGIDRVRDERVVGPLGFGPSRRKEPPILGLGDLTMALIEANLAGLVDLFAAGGLRDALAERRLTVGTVRTWEVAEGVARDLAAARDVAARAATVARPFATDATARSLIALGAPLKAARFQAQGLLATVAALSVGFNATDGD
jgi:hypothetical protein